MGREPGGQHFLTSVQKSGELSILELEVFYMYIPSVFVYLFKITLIYLFDDTKYYHAMSFSFK